MNNDITVLISHDSRDEKIAAELKAFLEDIFLNVHFYVAGRDLMGGQVWIEQIKNHLKSSQIIISLITPKSLDNKWVYFESGAGFTSDKTIPLITGSLKLEELTPPMSLLQARTLSIDGVALFIRDISEKLSLREPRNYPNIGTLIGKIEKFISIENTLSLQALLSKNENNKNSANQWIYKENCLVHDFTIEKKHRVSVDTFFSIDKIEILLFAREGSEEYVSDMINQSSFLPQQSNQYKMKGNRLIFQSFANNEKLETVEKYLTDLLNRIEIYKNKVEIS